MTGSESAPGTVLVTAATGTVGRHVVPELAEGDTAVRIGSRDPAAAREQFGDAGTAVDFDFDRPETWGRALEGVDGLFLVKPPGVATSRIAEFVDAAARVGVDRVAYLSTLGADRNVLIPHHRIERHIEESGPTHAFLRASFFMQNLHEVHGRDVVERDEIFVPAGSGETSFVDARDVAAVAVRVLTEPGHANVAYDLTGPEALDYDAVAAAFTEVLGREITYADPSVPAFVSRMWSRHPPGYVLLMVGIYTTARLGLAGRVTDDVERLLGRPPRGIEEYVADYADRFRRGDGTEAGTGPGGDRTTDGDRSGVTAGDPPPDWLLRVVNPLLKGVLRSPLHGLVSDDLLLLTVTGRSTGTEYTFPVAYERDGDRLYVTSHGTNWWKNLRDGGARVEVRLRNERRTGDAEVVEDDAAVAAYLRDYLAEHGVGVARRVGLEIEGETVPDEATLREAVGHVVLVEIDLDPA